MAKADHANWIAMKPKIKAAFAALKTAGITAKMNFSISISNGISEIYDPKFRGYAFWHSQDHVRVREDGVVTLAFGTFAKKATDQAIVGIGREVRAALEAQKLFVDWNDSADSRIDVHLSKAAKTKQEKAALKAYEARVAKEAAATAKLDLPAMRLQLIAAVDALPDDLSWVDDSGLDDKKREAALKGKTTLVALLPLSRPVITDGEVTIFLRRGSKCQWDGEKHKQMVAVRLKNELKKQGVTARVWSGMVLVKV